MDHAVTQIHNVLAISTQDTTHVFVIMDIMEQVLKATVIYVLTELTGIFGIHVITALTSITKQENHLQ